MLTSNEFLCFELEMGGRILAWFGIINYGIAGLWAAQQVYGIDEQMHFICKQLEKLILMIFGRGSDNSEFQGFNIEGHIESKECSAMVESIHPTVTVLLASALLMYCVLFIVSILLNIGIKFKNHWCILPSVIAYGIISIVYVTLGILIVFKFEYVLFIALFGIINNFYITVVLFSLYEKIKKENDSLPSAV